MAVRDASKKRDFELPAGCAVTTDPMAVVNDSNVEMVVELMGGVTLAKDVVFKALELGKKVVSGNKALIAAFLPQIQELCSKHGGAFGYEAAVCGGIPIIQAMRNDFVGDNVTSVKGIMNGTTNFILTKMEREGVAYETVLKEAQALGYAETPPDFDVEGWDARSKLAILCKLGFGVFVPEDKIPCVGITRVTSDDFKYAEMLDSTVKILGVASKDSAGSVSAYVSICMVSKSNQLAQIAGVLNCVSVESDNLGDTFFSGKGAGRFPTANSVVNDMVAMATGNAGLPFPVQSEAAIVSEVTGRFYIRLVIQDGIGIIKVLGELAEKEGISVHSIHQIPILDPKKVPMALTTDKTTLTQVKAMCDGIAAQGWNVEAPLVMPIFS
jgi:homoserine dehydrogenase